MSSHQVFASRLHRRRHHLLAFLASVAAFSTVPTAALAASDPECPPPQTRDRRNWKNPDCGVHNMLVVGEKALFMSHLPMFASEHRYQIILEAKLKQAGRDVTATYLQDRATHPQSRMYTVEPSDFFVLSRVIAKNGATAARQSFDAAVFRGHLERKPSQVIPGLDKVQVEIQRVLYAAELTPVSVAPRELTYILFGKDGNFFLAHQIARAPDFDQIIGVTFAQQVFKPEELQQGVTIFFPARPNSPDKRLKANESVEARARFAGNSQPLALRLTAGKEFYFEEGELKKKPVFDQTPLERAAGF